MKLLDTVRDKIRAHACKWETLPTIQAMQPDGITDDDREFDRDMEYLQDLTTRVVEELRRTAPHMEPAELARLCEDYASALRVVADLDGEGVA